MMTCKLVCLLLLGLAAFAYSVPVSQEISDLDDGDFISIEMFDDSEEERGLLTNSKGKDRCSCTSGNSCQCCASPRIPVIGKFPTCLKVELNADEKTANVKIETHGKPLIEKTMSTAKADRVCDRLPGALEDTKICLYSDISDLPDKTGIQSCSKIDIMQSSKTVAKIIFACAQFTGGKISLNDNGDVSSNDLFKIKTGDPIKGLLNWLGLRQPSNKGE